MRITEQNLAEARLKYREADMEFHKALDEYDTLCEYAALSNEDFNPLKRKARYEIEVTLTKALDAKKEGMKQEADYKYQEQAIALGYKGDEFNGV